MSHKKNTQLKGIAILLFATFLFSLFGIFTRLLADQMGVFYQLFTRAILMSLLFFVIAYATKSLQKIEPSDIRLFLLRGVFVVVDFSCFYIAVTHLQLGVTQFLFYAASVGANFVYGSLFLHEKITRIKIVSLILAILGLLIIYGNSFGTITIFASFAALLSGVAFGIGVSSSKNLTDKYSVAQVNLVAYSTAAVIAAPLLIFTKETIRLSLPTEVWLWLVLFAIVGVAAFYATIYGYKLLEAQKASLIMLAELIFVILVGLLFYKEIPTISSLIGGIFIVTALALPNFSFGKNDG